MALQTFRFFSKRLVLAVSGAALLIWGWMQSSDVNAGQAARSWSRPGHEDLSFWVNHEGLTDFHLEGEVGYGDLARLLMRRRANGPSMRKVRDRFTSPVRDLGQIGTPDLFRVIVTDSGIEWGNRPERYVVGVNRILNLPMIVENRSRGRIDIQAQFTPSSNVPALVSAFEPVRLDVNAASAFFLEVLEAEAGLRTGRLSVRAGQHQMETEVQLDVRPLVPLTVRLEDEDGAPVAARLYLTGADGLAYTPAGHVTRITAMSAEYYFHAEGSFELDLPSGPTVIETTRGLEYDLTRNEINLKPGEPREVRVRLKRWVNMASRGWYSSDAHIHANYTASHHQVMKPVDMRLQTFAEDLNIANLMVANSGSSFLHDRRYFDGKPHPLSGLNHILYWNEEMRAGLYGHMCFYGLKELVHPAYTGFGGTPNWENYPPNYVQARKAREQGGAVTYAHPIGGGETKPDSARLQPLGRLYPPVVPVSYETAGVKELPVDLALGEVDAFDVFSNADEIGAMEIWYRLLNCGFRLGISAGSDAFTNVVDHYTPGGGRVYVRTGNELDYAEWIAGYKSGRSFATNGPIIDFSVNGEAPGEQIRVPKESPNVRVVATVRSRVPVERVEVVVNGKVLVSRETRGLDDLTIDEEVAVKRSSWIAVRAYGPWHRLVLNDLQTFAHTSPVYVDVGGQPIGLARDAAFYADWVQKLIAEVNSRGRFASEQRRREVIDLFSRALRRYRQIENSIEEGQR